MDRRRFALLLPAFALGGFATGCGTIHPQACRSHCGFPFGRATLRANDTLASYGCW
jgi:hypothetical protein